MSQAPAPAPAPVSTSSELDAAPAKTRKRRGFAAMDPELQRQIASQGGRAAHAGGNAHEFTSEEARAAGAKSRPRPTPPRKN
jgi:general stress protein YciG